MRTTILALAMMLGMGETSAAQRTAPTSAEAQRANAHYAEGWKQMRSEAWAQAAREFQLAIDSDRNFKLAYYALGRAEMGSRNFAKAAAAYVKCRELYVSDAGERFSSQLDRRQRIEDRLFEYRQRLRDITARGTSSAAQAQNLYIRELQTEVTRLEQMRDRDINVTVDTTVPFFVPMALGTAYFRSGQMADAEREYKVAIAANPSSGETYNNLAVVYMLTGRFEEAQKAVAQAKKAGFKVNPELERDIKDRKGGA